MASLTDIILQLQQQAGPRGSTFAGRVVPQGQYPSLTELLMRPPTEPVEGEGMGGALLGAAGAVRRGTQDVLGDLIKRKEAEMAQHGIQAIEGRIKYQGMLPKYATDVQMEEFAKGLAKGKSPLGTPSTYAELLRQSFNLPGSDPTRPVYTIMTSPHLGALSMEERAAIVKLADFRGDLDRLFMPDKLKLLRDWANKILPSPSAQEVLTRHLRPKS